VFKSVRTIVKILSLLVLFSLEHNSFSQDKKRIDSTRTILKDPNLSDKKKSWYLAQLGWDVSYYDLEEGLTYAEEAISISKKNNFLKETAGSECNPRFHLVAMRHARWERRPADVYRSNPKKGYLCSGSLSSPLQANHERPHHVLPRKHQ